MTFALLLASLIGLSLGLLGSGGSIITLPVMVYIAGIPPYALGTLPAGQKSTVETAYATLFES